MSKLIFKYAPMDAGKSLDLLKTAHTYEVKGRQVLCFKPRQDTREKGCVIRSRLGIGRTAIPIHEDNPNYLFDRVDATRPDVVFIDEAQFMTREAVEQAARIVEELGISVIAYGLKNDFRNQLFEGSAALLALADRFDEIKTICAKCERKAIMNLRLVNGIAASEGEQIQIGDEEYISVCRRHYKEAFKHEKQAHEKEEEGTTQEAPSAKV